MRRRGNLDGNYTRTKRGEDVHEGKTRGYTRGKIKGKLHNMKNKNE